MRKGLFIIAPMLLLLANILPSCKEGCRDPKALNYDHSAKTDNGMCLYCDTGSYHSSVNTKASDFDSSFSSFEVASFDFEQDGLHQQGNGCRSIGLAAGQGCNINLTIKNLMNKHVQGNYSVTFFNSQNTQSWSQTFNSINLYPHDSLRINNFITNQCDTLDKGFFNIQLNNMTYQ